MLENSGKQNILFWGFLLSWKRHMENEEKKNKVKATLVKKETRKSQNYNCAYFYD